MIPAWLDLDWSGDTLYLTASCVVSLLLVLTDVILLKARERAILGHLGWDEADLDRPTEPLPEAPRDA